MNKYRVYVPVVIYADNIDNAICKLDDLYGISEWADFDAEVAYDILREDKEEPIYLVREVAEA